MLRNQTKRKPWVDELFPYVGTFKVGLQLYTKYGNEVVDYISGKNSNFFLDVKLHDIPNTVEKASENVVLKGANFFNVHATGGLAMMEAAARGAKKASEKLGKKTACNPCSDYAYKYFTGSYE